MRVLFQLIGGDHGGGQSVAADIAAALRDRGHEIGVVVPTTGPALTPFERLGARIHLADLGSLRRPWAVGRGAAVVRTYDLLYSHTSVPGEILGSAAARLARRPQLVHRHSYLDLSPREPVRTAHRLLYRAALRGRRVVAVAEHVKLELVRFGIDPDRIVVIPNGTAIPATVPGKRATGPLRIGMLGRLDAQKAGDLFVAAARRARLDRPADWTMAGGPGPDPAYEARLRSTASEAGVAVEGRVDGLVFLRGLDIVVVPSRYEAHPLVLLEALALGRAVIAADIPGMRDVLQSGGGLLVQPDDEHALAAAIERLASDERGRVALGERAREVARERYDLATAVGRVVAVVEETGLSRAPTGTRP
jgi:glycosyltransferase involved in cell wall biosynthesis